MLTTNSRNRLLDGLDLQNLIGIEIGALTTPIVSKEEGHIEYVDRATTDELKSWYSINKSVDIDKIVDVDHVWGEYSLAEATGGSGKYDYCLASHVIEHVPDLITWLKEISEILKPGGVACFVVPDKRYTFDHTRTLTSTAELVESYMNRARRPSVRQIYDHFSHHTLIDLSDAWNDRFDRAKLRPEYSPKGAYDACLSSMEKGAYIDSHCSVFSDTSFFELLREVNVLGLLDMKVRRYFATTKGLLEFVVQLEKVDPELGVEGKRKEIKESITQRANCLIQLEVSCNVACTTQLFYDTGSGFNEAESIILNYDIPGSVKVLEHRIPMPLVSGIRFDPENGPVEIKIHSLKEVRSGIACEQELNCIKASNEIESIEPHDNILVIKTTEDAQDPSVLIEL